MIIKLLILTNMTYSIFGFNFSEQTVIHEKKSLIRVLTAEIEEARENGTAETMDIVEKIHYVWNLEEEITELEAQQ